MNTCEKCGSILLEDEKNCVFCKIIKKIDNAKNVLLDIQDIIENLEENKLTKKELKQKIDIALEALR